jgi:signal transduction histidine kinase/ActR/RegA family two-component response regulator
MRHLTLGRRLFVLALAGILPLAIMSAIALIALVLQQRTQAESDSLEIARALAIAVEGEVQRSITALGTLSTANSLDAGNLQHFRLRAERLQHTQPNWLAIILADPRGNVLMNTNFPGPDIPPIVERESFDEAVRTREPVVGRLMRGRLGQYGVPLRVPVVQDNELRYVLTGVVKPQAIADVIDRQRTPNDWVVSVFDGKGLRVARSRSHEKFLGTTGSESLQRLLSGSADEGTGETLVLDGGRVYTAFVRMKSIGWTVTIGIPVSTIDMSGYRSLAVFGGGLLLSLGLGILGAYVVARRISRPIAELHRTAQALGSGRFATATATDTAVRDIPETREVADALAAATTQLAANAAEREKLLADTESARRQAETANRAKDEFLAMLGHELRNPLASIVNALELMKIRDGAADVQERQIIGRQITHLSHLVDDLLDVSRITKGKIQLQRKPIDVRTVVARALELATPVLDKRERPVDIDVPSEPLFVLGDEIRLAQVLSNLLLNAAKFTPGTGRIALRARAANGMAEIAIEDAGSGIAADLLPHVFEVFMQGSQPIDRQVGGLGLGLAIVKALVEMHGGTVSADSKGVGRGSVFVVRIPILDGAAPQAAPERPIAMPASGSLRLLVVDDNVDAAETMAELLREAAGYDVRIETSGHAALAALETFAPDVAILDIGLPGMTGYELAQKLRANERFAGMHLIAVTGYGARQDRERALESGFDEHLTKPVRLARLLEAIAQATGKTETREA